MGNVWKFRKLCAVICVFLAITLSGCMAADNLQETVPSTGNLEDTTVIIESPDEEDQYSENIAQTEENTTPITYFLADINFLNIEDTIDMLQKAKADIITVPLSWCYLEPSEGMWDTDVYSQILDIFVEEGFSFIFILDAGNRQITNESGEIVNYSIPEWVYEKAGFDVMLDFTGAKVTSGSMQYVSDSTLQYYLDYCEKVIDYFGTRYRDNTVGFAPGVMSEFEIKYPQINFAWNDYSNEALQAFREYLRLEYSTVATMNEITGTDYRSFSEVVFPVINYNNSFVSGSLYDEPLYVDFQNFRSLALENFLAPVYELIHAKGFTTVSYFAQVLHPHDGIYNSGIAVNLAEYVDIAVVDYNFYDGYGLVFDTVLPAMMTNYLKSAGYANVWSGIYLERMDFRDYDAEIQETITYCVMSGVCDGLEIGGVVTTLYKDPNAKIPKFDIELRQRSEPAKVAIYVSEWNFYHSHGENPDYIDYFTDCITQMYKIVQFELGIEVDVIPDSVILSDKITQYDLIIAPGAFFVDAEVKEAIRTYVLNGGTLLQDFRFGEWDAYCNNSGDWLDELYGLSNREALSVISDVLIPVNEELQVFGECKIQEFEYPKLANLYSVASCDPDAYLFENQDGKKIGLLGTNSICLGFQPQVQYKYADDVHKQQYVKLIEWAIDTLLNK